jgi:hypothetical protein
MMTIRSISIGALIAAGVVGLSAREQAPRAPAGVRYQVLVPVAGTWTADYENANQILTIDGAAPAKAPDAEAARALYGDAASSLVKALAQPGAYPIAIVRDVREFSGGRLQVQFKLVGGASDQTAGILFNLRPDGSYHYARYNTKDGNVAIWTFENGARSVLMHGTAHEQLPLNAWHTLEVVIAGTRVTATANGRLTATHVLEAPVSGRVGVWTKTDSVTAFRHFQAQGRHHRP